MPNNPFDMRFAESLAPNNKYLLIGRFEAIACSFFWLGDLDTMDYCPSVWKLDGKPQNYLETEEFAPLRELIEITNNDYRTHDIVYTSDMLSIPRFAEKKMIVSKGRALTTEDDGTSHCVKKTHLNIGDTITMDLCSKLLEQHSGMGTVNCITERYSPPVKKEALEIVGACIDTDTSNVRNANMYWGFLSLHFFVFMGLFLD